MAKHNAVSVIQARNNSALYERLWRFLTVLSLAVRIYAGYKSIQLWSRFVSDATEGALTGARICAPHAPFTAPRSSSKAC